MRDWQPIETAPKDGTMVKAAAESRLRALEVLRFPYPLKQRWNGVAWEADDGRVYEPQPTHWLPSPPVSGTAEGSMNHNDRRGR